MEGILHFIRSIPALNFSLMCFSIIELLFFRSAARTHLHSCLSFFVVTPGKRWRLKVLFFACLTLVCERCTKSARHLTWCDGLASPMDCVTSLCKHESPGSSLISFASQERSFGTHFVFREWLMLLTVLQLAVQFFWSSLFQRCYTGVYSPLVCSRFHSRHQSSAGQFCHRLSCSFGAFHSQRLETSQGQQAESAAS